MVKRLYQGAGIYGLLVLAPQYFLEARIGIDSPPAITHPEFFYGFLGVAMAWQLAFFLIAADPVRYRMMMLPAIVEKLSFGLATAILFATGRLATQTMIVCSLDWVFAFAFIAAFRFTPHEATASLGAGVEARRQLR